MRTNVWAVCAAALGAVGAALGAGPEGETLVEREGLKFAITAVSAAAHWYPRSETGPRLERSLNVTAIVGGEPGTPVVPGVLRLTEVRDGEGRDLLAAGRVPMKRPLERGMLGPSLQAAAAVETGTTQQVGASVYELPALPGRLAVLKGSVEAYTGELKTVMMKLEAMEEPLEPAPGMKVLIGKIEETPLGVAVDVEVRIARCRDGKAGDEGGCVPGLEPMFLSLMGVDEKGARLYHVDRLRWVDTRDEYIGVAQAWTLTKETAARTKGLELRLAHAVRPVRFEFELKDLVLGGEE